MSIARRIEDWDDYYDVCQELQVTPGDFPEDFYKHWKILEDRKHKIKEPIKYPEDDRK